MTFRAVAVDGDFARDVRRSRRDAFGGEAELWRAADRYPCRHCLDEARMDSDVLLLSYKPLEFETPYAERGPIFLCAEACPAYSAPNAVPEIVATRRVNLRAYDSSGKMLYRHSRLAEGSEVQLQIEEILADETVREIHAHTALHGCYLCKFIRDYTPESAAFAGADNQPRYC
jgi:hypothetical protein